jgi:hypothetical protein
MRVLPIPDALPASSSTELLALPHLIAQPPLPSQRLEASFHKYRGVSRSLRCLAIDTAAARPAVDGLHPAQLGPICLCHPIGDARSSFSAPFRPSLSRVGRHFSRRSRISRFERCIALHHTFTSRAVAAHSSRGRTDPPDARATGRPWHRDRE